MIRTEIWPARDCACAPGRLVTIDETPTVPLGGGRALRPHASVVTPPPISGSTLRSRYVLEESIGQGGTSIVFRAQDLLRGHAVGVKVLRSDCCADPPTVRRLWHEFLQMQSLSHPGIVRVFEFDCDGNTQFMSMELIAGLTVKDWMATPRSYPDALKLVASCCSALAHAHSVGVLHGDLKPTNVMVTADGTARLVDFGSASSLAAEVETATLTLAATPSYASPQILAGNSADQRDDIYSLACLTYSILSGGRHPFGGRPSFEHGRAKRAPSYARAIPPELFKVIERSLSVEPEGRAASAREFLNDLLDADRRHRTADAPRAADHITRRRFSFANALVGVLAVVGVVSLQLDRQRQLISAAKTATELPRRASTTAPQLPAGISGLAISLPEIHFPSRSAGLISFDAPTTVHVSTQQSLVAINVRRTPAGGRASFVWRLKNVVGFLDLDQRDLAPRRVTFNEGQVVRTLFIPLIGSNTRLTRRPGSFSVVLQRAAGGPALGRITRVQVIADPAPSVPYVTIQARVGE
jgi:serine/threonine protein kinase